jgi:hypothetical protein
MLWSGNWDSGTILSGFQAVGHSELVQMDDTSPNHRSARRRTLPRYGVLEDQSSYVPRHGIWPAVIEEQSVPSTAVPETAERRVRPARLTQEANVAGFFHGRPRQWTGIAGLQRFARTKTATPACYNLPGLRRDGGGSGGWAQDRQGVRRPLDLALVRLLNIHVVDFEEPAQHHVEIVAGFDVAV